MSKLLERSGQRITPAREDRLRRTGRAALDAAIELDIPHGGWIPKGRKTEDGRLPEKYQLKEMPTGSYAARTEQNVIDSDGTLIISHGKLNSSPAMPRRLLGTHDV
jgi:hypothetical protein